MELRRLQHDLRTLVDINNRRKRIIRDRAIDELAYQEYQMVVNDINRQVDQAFQRRFVSICAYYCCTGTDFFTILSEPPSSARSAYCRRAMRPCWMALAGCWSAAATFCASSNHCSPKSGTPSRSRRFSATRVSCSTRSRSSRIRSRFLCPRHPHPCQFRWRPPPPVCIFNVFSSME